MWIRSGHRRHPHRRSSPLFLSYVLAFVAQDMKATAWITLCIGSVFALGYLVGALLTHRTVEATARSHIERFSDEVHILEGRVIAMEDICR